MKILHRLRGLYATIFFDEERLIRVMQSIEPEGFTLSYGHDISLTQPDRFSSPPNPCTNCMFDHAQIFGTILFESFEVDPQETWISKQIHNSRSCTPRDIFKIA